MKFKELLSKFKRERTTYIETEDDLLKAVVGVIERSYKANENANNLRLEVDIYDSNLYNSLGIEQNSRKFADRLAEKIATELDTTFSDVVITNKEPDSSWKRLNDYEVYWRVKGRHAKAVLKTIKGYGAFVTAEYSLCPGNTYNIGRGEYVQLDNGALRTNNIVIDDSDDSPEAANNQYVSRNHAHISYQEKECKLYVDAGGRRNVNSRTTVQRGEEIIDLLSDMTNPIQLKNNDIIELGKHVKILFSYINE